MLAIDTSYNDDGMKFPVYTIFGVGGLLGNAFHKRLSERVPDFRIFSFDHARADILSPAQVGPLLDFIRPTVVINCSALSDPWTCEHARQGAFLTNARGPEVLAQECDRVGAKLVHLSTYQVFDGKRKTPYTEKSIPRPLSAYGRSKWDGEMAVRRIIPNHLLIRPGWLFHWENKNALLDWITAAEQGQDIGIPDARCSPTFVNDLVDAVMDLVGLDARGTFNIANSGEATIKQLVEETLDLARLRASVVSRPNALVPRYGVLSINKYKSLCHKDPRHWSFALKQCLFLMNRYSP